MRYLNANRILPDSLVDELQNYVQGVYLYVPIQEERRKRWGELSNYRMELQTRNREIIEKHRQGVSLEELSGSYHLSVHAVRKIIYTK